jgi:hypothetical protein
MEKIKKAIESDELDLFLMGIGNYHVSGWSDLDEPDDYDKCWNTEIIPYVNSYGDAFWFESKRSIHKLLSYEPDANLGIYSALMFFNWYYFFKSQGQISFQIDLTEFIAPVKEKLKKRKPELIKDKRWSGVEWNSKNGLWGSAIRITKFIREKYNGVDLVPNDE